MAPSLSQEVLGVDQDGSAEGSRVMSGWVSCCVLGDSGVVRVGAGAGEDEDMSKGKRREERKGTGGYALLSK
jgi:hypothetical protein